MFLEAQRWGEDRLPEVYPVCEVVRTPYVLESRPGYFWCRESACRAEFTVRTGTVMERFCISGFSWSICSYPPAGNRLGAVVAPDWCDLEVCMVHAATPARCVRQ